MLIPRIFKANYPKAKDSAGKVIVYLKSLELDNILIWLNKNEKTDS